MRNGSWYDKIIKEVKKNEEKKNQRKEGKNKKNSRKDEVGALQQDAN